MEENEQRSNLYVVYNEKVNIHEEVIEEEGKESDDDERGFREIAELL